MTSSLNKDITFFALGLLIGNPHGRKMAEDFLESITQSENNRRHNDILKELREIKRAMVEVMEAIFSCAGDQEP